MSNVLCALLIFLLCSRVVVNDHIDRCHVTSFGPFPFEIRLIRWNTYLLKLKIMNYENLYIQSYKCS